MPRQKPREGRWYLHRLEEGIAVLRAEIPKDPSKLACPKCLAPMLSIGKNQVICYACGMTFDVEGGSVSRTLREDEMERMLSSPSVVLSEGIRDNASPSAEREGGKRSPPQ